MKCRTYSGLAAAALILCLAGLGAAQSEVKKLEVGVQFTSFTLFPPPREGFQPPSVTEPGFGGRFTYNLTNRIAVESELNFFPHKNIFQFLGDGRALQGQFGIKFGKRFKKFGVFAKGRPGFLRLGKGDFRMRPALCPGDIPEPIGCFDPVAKTSFAFDAGGIVEYYPNKRLVVRFDAGDTILHFGERLAVTSVPALNPGVTIPFKIGLLGAPAETTHNFQGSIGVGFRF